MALAIWLSSGSARADEPAAEPDGRAAVAPLAGALTALVPLMVGSVLVAHDDNRALQRDGIAVMLAGFAAAPWVSHGVAGRWRRALAFGLASVAVSAATLAVMTARDPFDPTISNHKRLPFGFLLTASFFVGAAGVVDSFVVGPSARAP
jgi:hypothetical protein